MRILAGLETRNLAAGVAAVRAPGRLQVPAPLFLAIERDDLPSSALPYAGERISMRHHDMWASASGPVVGLSGVFGSGGPRICRMLHLDFGEYLFRNCPKTLSDPKTKAAKSYETRQSGPISPGYERDFYPRDTAERLLGSFSTHSDA
jgi:hypothetical protein